MERKSLSCVLNLLIENGKGDDTYYLFDSNDNLIVKKKMSVKTMLGQLGYYVLLCQPVLKIVEKNIILYCEVFINDTKR